MFHYHEIVWHRFKNANQQAIWLGAHPECLLHSILTKPARFAHSRDVRVYQFVSLKACAEMKTYLREHQMTGYKFRDHGFAARKRELAKRKIQKLYFGG